MNPEPYLGSICTVSIQILQASMVMNVEIVSNEIGRQ